MAAIVTFRKFEERDIDFIFKCKNDERLNTLTVGQNHPFTYEEAAQWVRNCMKGDRPDLKFWAICTNDESKRIIGWISLSQIDGNNKSACFHGIVIGDPNYRDGAAWIESYLFILSYFFEKMSYNRLYGTYFPEHVMTKSIANSVFFYTEGIYRQSAFKNGRFHDVVFASLLSSEYYEHKKKGEYTYNSILKRLIKEIKNNKQ